MGNSSEKEDHSSLYNLIQSLQTKSAQCVLFPDRNIRLIKIATVDNQSKMYAKLQQKKNNHCQHISKVLNFVEAPSADTLCSRVKTYYILIQHLQFSLADAINKKVKEGGYFTQQQIWNFLNQAIIIARHLKKYGKMHPIFCLKNVFIKQDGQYCINDPELFQDIYQETLYQSVENCLGQIANAMATIKNTLLSKQCSILSQNYSSSLIQIIHKLTQGTINLSQLSNFIIEKQGKSEDNSSQSLPSTARRDKRKKLSLTLKEENVIGKQNLISNELLLSVDLNTEGAFTFNGNKQKKNRLNGDEINHCFPKAKVHKPRLSHVYNKDKNQDSITAQGTSKNSIMEDILQLNDIDEKIQEEVLFSSYKVRKMQIQNTFENIGNIKNIKAKPYKYRQQQIQVTQIHIQNQFMLDLLAQHKQYN